MNTRLKIVETLRERELQFKGRRKRYNLNSINSNNNSTINISNCKRKFSIKKQSNKQSEICKK